MTAGGKTCFLEVTSVRLGKALQRDLGGLPGLWAEKGAVWCDDYDFRAGACARTWLRPHAQDNLMCGRPPCKMDLGPMLCQPARAWLRPHMQDNLMSGPPARRL